LEPYELGELVKLDWGLVANDISMFIVENVPENKRGVVVGVSGGVDSACVLALCSKALGSTRILTLILPDSRVTPRTDVEDSRKLCKIFGVETREHDIGALHSAFTKELAAEDKIAGGNLRARIRMTLLYFYANLENRLVCGTGDRSEAMIGYYTKFGDGGVDLLPIGGLYKCQVRGLAEFLGVPREVYLKESSPHLWVEHSAESEIGLTYDEVDIVCHLLFDRNLPVEDTARMSGLTKEKVKRVVLLNQLSSHKRRLPPSPEPPQVR
jgi:NAD+ synthase